MKNLLFEDLRYVVLTELRRAHTFYGGYLTKEQKEKLKNDICATIDRFKVTGAEEE